MSLRSYEASDGSNLFLVRCIQANGICLTCQFPERCQFTLTCSKLISTARCARLSYKPFDGNADYDAEVSRYEKLVVSSPVHASPAEHQATPDTFSHTLGGGWDHPGEHGNFYGWRQHRKMIPGEAIMETTW
jgi:hypothetical protein